MADDWRPAKTRTIDFRSFRARHKLARLQVPNAPDSQLAAPRIRPSQLSELQRAGNSRRVAGLLVSHRWRGQDVLGRRRRDVLRPAWDHAGAGDPRWADPWTLGH